MLIAQEKQVLQQQFGSGNGAVGGMAHPPPPSSVVPQPAPAATGVVGGAHPYMAPPPITTSSFNPTSLQFQSLSLHDPTQAGPLPPKLDHTMGLDQSIASTGAGAPPLPPPYQPPSFHHQQQPPPPSLSVSALPTDSMAVSSGTGYSTYQQQHQPPPPPHSLQPSFTQPQQIGMSPSSMASLQPPTQMNEQPHSLESLLSVPPVGGGGGGAGGQPSSLPTQLSSGVPTSETSFQPFQPQPSGGGFGGGAPPPSLGGPHPPPPPPAQHANTGMMPPAAGGYQQPGHGVGGGSAYSSQPPLPPPGVTSFHQPQQFGAPPPPSMHVQMHAPVAVGGGFIPNGAHQGQAPPQPHPPPSVGRQESQPPLISFD